MLKINVPKFDLLKAGIAKRVEKIKNNDVPDFAAFMPSIKVLKKKLKKYQKYKNMIVIGNGGARTSFFAMYNALGSSMNVEFVTTSEPDFLNKVKKKFDKKDTVVVAVSKSGQTVTVLESLLFFRGYTTVAVTGGGALQQIAKKKEWLLIEHPPVGGRFSAFTSAGLVPAVIAGLNVEKLWEGALKIYKKSSPNRALPANRALYLASYLFLLEKRGYSEVFTPVYSTELFAAFPLVVQLMHESVCKNGRGQTFFGDLAPESQHHTNQRFFGGKKNCAGLFMRVLDQRSGAKISVPKSLAGVDLRDGSLSVLDGIPYAKALEFEFKGTFEDAKNNDIPALVVSVDRISAHSLGEFIAFWQYVAVYSSWLRGVDAFNQPQVEASKKLSFKFRKKYK